MTIRTLYWDHIARIAQAILLCTIFLVLPIGVNNADAAEEHTCGGGEFLEPLSKDQGLPDLKVIGECYVGPGEKYFYGQVNIVQETKDGKVSNGALLFREYDANLDFQPNPDNKVTEFWASSIIIENCGIMDIHAIGDPRQDEEYARRCRFSDSDDDGTARGRTRERNGGFTRLQPSDGGERESPYGKYGGTLKIYLYGNDEAHWNPSSQTFDTQNKGALCKSAPDDLGAPCGIPDDIWMTNGSELVDLPGFRGSEKDYFYQYGPLRADAATDEKGKVGYFGKKVLAVSYGGTLEISGYKGACTDREIQRWVFDCGDLTADDPTRSSPGWTRLKENLKKDQDLLTLEHAFKGAEVDDQIIVTTTDYLPNHSEVLKIAEPPAFNTLQFKDSGCSGACYDHNGTRYDLNSKIGEGTVAYDRLTKDSQSDREPGNIDKDLIRDGAETRAAVAHLTRSVQIISAGDGPETHFPDADYRDPVTKKPYYFGAHTIARQGFMKFEIQGVEFVNMGQGGRMGHYPVHFHKARKTPPNTFVRDSVINVSMTRWIVLHSTVGVELSRNIGYKSIGHGYYLEDGTETENQLYSNLGILARAAVEDDLNPRRVPGILSANNLNIKSKSNSLPYQVKNIPYRSDSLFPTAFWITNGWNEFVGNMAVGTGACGAAYWLLPAANSDRPAVTGNDGWVHMNWNNLGYSALQMKHKADEKDSDWAGTSPLKSFYKNYASTTALSMQTTADAPECTTVGYYPPKEFVDSPTPPPTHSLPHVLAVESISPTPKHQEDANGAVQFDIYDDRYYPHILDGKRRPTLCKKDNGRYDCSSVPLTDICSNENQTNCAVTVLDHYTSSFHFAHGSISAIWLRPDWYLVDNSVLTDVQNGGLTFVTGGDYTFSNIQRGYWALARNSIFIGETQPENEFALAKGPFNGTSKLKCSIKTGQGEPGNYCLSIEEGISLNTSGWSSNQRFFNIYDGPNYQDSNVFLAIRKSDCERGLYNGDCMYGFKSFNVLKGADGKCYLPNAAIGWKQPNGFYYPPAFHSRNLFFKDVDIRHFVIDPIFKAGD